MVKTEIRLAKTADLPAIERLNDIVQTLHAEARPDLFRIPVDSEGRRALLDRTIGDEHWRIWVAETAGQTVAYLMTEIWHKEGPFRHPYTEGHLHQICVDPKFQRQGIGLGLIQHALSDFKARKTDRITVAHWAFNEGSKALFSAAGFAPVVTTSELLRHKAKRRSGHPARISKDRPS